MLAKLLALVTQLKAAGVTVVILAGAATATVTATNPDVQSTLQQLTSNVSQTSSVRTDCDQGQPAVVSQRNAADKLLRAAFQVDQKALQDLRGGKDVDNKAVGEIVKKYDDQLKDTLNTALNKVASLTLGRVGQNRSASPSGSPVPSISPSTSPSPSGTTSTTPTCPPAASGAPAATPSASPNASGSGKPDVQGRVAVAERTTLDADIQAIVDQAIKDMDDLVTKATAEATALPPVEHGKPSDNPAGGKPSVNPGNKPSDNPGNKPSDKGKPTSNP